MTPKHTFQIAFCVPSEVVFLPRTRRSKAELLPAPLREGGRVPSPRRRRRDLSLENAAGVSSPAAALNSADDGTTTVGMRTLLLNQKVLELCVEQSRKQEEIQCMEIKAAALPWG